MFRKILYMAVCALLVLSPFGLLTQSVSAATVGPVRATVDNAIYDWWAQPAAVNDGAYTWLGSIARLGTVRVFKTNPATGAVQTATLSKIKADEHNTPALAYDAGQTNIIAFYTNHSADRYMRYNTINRNTLAVGPEKRLTFSNNITYAQVLRSGSRLVVFTRVASSKWAYMVSNNFGATWSAERTFMNATNFGQVYMVVKPVPGNANENLLAFYGHPTNSTYRKIEYARIWLESGNIKRANNQVIGNLYSWGGPSFTPGTLDVAVTPPSGQKVRLLDISTVGTTPAIAYAIWQGDTGPASYKVARHNGTSWTTPAWSLASGEPFGFTPATHYIGGMAIGRNNRLYTSRQNDTTHVWYIEQWIWSAAQNNFVFEREVARDDTKPLIRPYVPARTGQTEVISLRLDKYNSYTDYDADILVY